MTLMKSFVPTANDPHSDFPLNNLPYGVFSANGGPKSQGIAIGDRILNLRSMVESRILSISTGVAGDAQNPFLQEDWNAFMELGPATWDAFRTLFQSMLAEGSELADVLEAHLIPIADATLHLPFAVAEFTDFYAGRHHATNVGTMFRGAENALPENWLHIPIGYNGRASSVVPSGTDVQRPHGQLKGPDFDAPIFAPSRRFDFELELGAIVGRASQGPLSVDQAFENIFGFVLLNDWSARDIQGWEYQPLGPFQSKATATSISPWIVTRSALEPFLCETPKRDVPLLPYLADTGPMLYDIALEVELNGHPIARTNVRELYYSAAQHLAHHTSSGCPMRIGDLLGSGTISGPDSGARGSMLELSWGGKEPIATPDGERSFLEDGDTVTFRGAAQGDGHRIGFGSCDGTVIPARDI